MHKACESVYSELHSTLIWHTNEAYESAISFLDAQNIWECYLPFALFVFCNIEYVAMLLWTMLKQDKSVICRLQYSIYCEAKGIRECCLPFGIAQYI